MPEILNDEQVAAINYALENGGGIHARAAELLDWEGWDGERIYATCQSNKYLREKWVDRSTTVKAPEIPEVTDIDRPEHINNEKVAAAMERQALALRSTMASLGFEGYEIDKAIAARDLQSKFAVDTLSMMGGGMVDTFFRLKSELGKILDELNDSRTSKKPMELEREMGLRGNMTDIVSAMQGCHDKSLKAMFMALEAKNKAKEKTQKKEPRTIGVTATVKPNANGNGKH